jgi:hypothetical protein
MGIGCSRGEVAQGGLGEAPLEAIVHAICTGKRDKHPGRNKVSRKQRKENSCLV